MALMIKYPCRSLARLQPTTTTAAKATTIDQRTMISAALVIGLALVALGWSAMIEFSYSGRQW